MSTSDAIRTAGRVSAAIALAIAVTVASSGANASPTFPGELQDVLDLPCAPACTICHKDLNGGLGTLATEFGRNMSLAGLLPTRPSTVAGATQQLEDPIGTGFVDQDGLPLCINPPEGATVTADNKCDGDGDGVGDIDELRAAMSPGTADDTDVCAGPAYGCGARIEPRSDLDGGAAFFALLAALGLFARRRR